MSSGKVNGGSTAPRRTPRALTARKIPPLLVGRASSNTPIESQPKSERGVVRKLTFREDSEEPPQNLRLPKRQRRSASPTSVLTASLSDDTDGSQNSEASSASVFRRRGSSCVPREQVVLLTRNLRLRCDVASGGTSGSQTPSSDEGRHPSVNAGPPTQQPDAQSPRPMGSSGSNSGAASPELPDAAEQAFVNPFKQFLHWSGLLKPSRSGNPLRRPPLQLRLPGDAGPAVPAAAIRAAEMPALPSTPVSPAEQAADRLGTLENMLQCISAAEKRARLAGQVAD